MTFMNGELMREARRSLKETVTENRNRLRPNGRLEQVDNLLLQPNSVVSDDFEEFQGDPSLAILNLLEADVVYTTRVCIDENIRAGKWYEVQRRQGNTSVTLREDLLVKPDVRCFAWDIETEKQPLKFPDPTRDEIMMISYMFSGEGFLIVNREIVAEDIQDLEYSPKLEYQAEFEVFNEADEYHLLQKFFNHIKELRPHVFVSFNGDFFDFPYVYKRAEFHGINMYLEIGIGPSRSDVIGDAPIYTGRIATHIDCFNWVQRDSFLPQGSQGLKAVTKAKLNYNPVELDPELMVEFAQKRPQELAAYSVSDAVATYYLYKKYIEDFIYALCSIVPMNADDVLRKGSGTLCELLLMAQAYEDRILIPNKHLAIGEEYALNRLVEASTYVGGHVESLLTGIFRADVEEDFSLDSSAFSMLIDEIDSTLDFFLQTEAKVELDEVENLSSVREEILKKLESLRDNPKRRETPVIYHLDVGAMYPNIILSNRLQPPAIVNEEICAVCPYNAPTNNCKRPMEWMWRGDLYMATKADVLSIKNQLEIEKFAARKIIPNPNIPNTAKPGSIPLEGEARRWQQLSGQEQMDELIKRVKSFSLRAYKRIKSSQFELRSHNVCQRENPFYVNTVRTFRDRRYEFKRLAKEWKSKVEKALEDGNAIAIAEARDTEFLYDSLQLAHKCILNSFYGYVMRKGSRWHSMVMAGIVTYKGSNIIREARELVERVGKPLELDTDGIWCLLPSSFPEIFTVKLKNGKKVKLEYPCSVLNQKLHHRHTNHQYQDLDPETGRYNKKSEMSIFFELDGPYKAMMIPSSTEEDRLLKKRYAVFNFDGSLSELKGFEIKRRGELKLIKVFQEEVFPAILGGTTLQEAYNSVGAVANRWLDVLDTKGKYISETEIVQLLSESKNMSKSVEESGSMKSMAVTTASRLAEFLGSQYLRDRGLACRFIVAEKPYSVPCTQRAIPVSIFSAETSRKNLYLRKWLGDPGHPDLSFRGVIDWDYYKQRLAAAIQKIISIPAAFQKIDNPVPRISLPDWMHKRVLAAMDKNKQQKIDSMFVKKVKEIGDIEDIKISNKRTKPMGVTYDESTIKKDEKKDKKIEKIEISKETIATIPKLLKNETNKGLAILKNCWKVHRQDIKNTKHKGGGALDHLKPKDAIGSLLSAQKDALKLYNWQIISAQPVVEGSDSFMLWVTTVETAQLFRTYVKVSRKYFLKSDEPVAEMENRISSGDPNVVMGRHKYLPRGLSAKYLYQITQNEKDFQDNLRHGSLCSDAQQRVYETKIPLNFDFILRYGGVVSLNPNEVSAEAWKANTFTDSALRQVPKANYLPQTPNIIYIHIGHSNESDRFFIAVFSHVFGLARFIFCADRFPDKNSNFQKFFRSIDPLFRGEERVDDENETADEEDETADEEDETADEQNETADEQNETADEQNKSDKQNKKVWMVKSQYVNSVENASSKLLSIIQEFKKLPHGVSITVLQCSCDPKQLGDIFDIEKFPFPIFQVQSYFEDSQYELQPLDWTSQAIRRSSVRFLDFYQKEYIYRLSISKTAKIPICLLPETAETVRQYSLDILYGRYLRKDGMILWVNEDDCPDIPDAINASVMAEELMESNACLGSSAQAGGSGLMKCTPGAYRSICATLDLGQSMTVAAIQNMRLLAEMEGSELFTVRVVDGNKKTDQTAGDDTNFHHSSEVSVSALLALQSMINFLIDDAVRNRQTDDETEGGGESILLSIQAWLASPSAYLFDPALKRQVTDFTEKLFNRVVNEVRRVNAHLIFADPKRLKFCTGRFKFEEAKAVADSLINCLNTKSMFELLTPVTTDWWACLLYMDEDDWSGLPMDAETGEAKIRPINQWQLANFLPPAVQGQFTGFETLYHYFIYIYIFNMFCDRLCGQFLMKPYQIGVKYQRENPDVIQFGKIQEALQLEVCRLVSDHFQTKLFWVLEQIQTAHMEEESNLTISKEELLTAEQLGDSEEIEAKEADIYQREMAWRFPELPTSTSEWLKSMKHNQSPNSSEFQLQVHVEFAKFALQVLCLDKAALEEVKVNSISRTLVIIVEIKTKRI
eukprot:GHVL01017390.1.p1 GENE.GHVL01017390.1~~GHVL01017390.1.p1  ORF type:complete len:2204 (+),score=478.22 GHVL01017390.1:451-6612(+)